MDPQFKIVLIGGLLLFSVAVLAVALLLVNRNKSGGRSHANDQQRIERLSKKHPSLKDLPEAERLSVVRQSGRHPLVLGTLLVLLAVWLWVAAEPIMGLTDNRIPRMERYLKMFAWGVVPAVLMIGVVVFIQGKIIKRRVREITGEAGRVRSSS
jgi:hypothetical protein